MSGDVPLLVGTTRDEWNLFSLMARDQMDDVALLRRLGRLVEDPHQMVATYRQAHDTSDHDALWSAIMTDRVFRIPAIRLAEAQAGHQPATFMYRFDWASTALDGRLGSCHALEIPFVFDGLRQPGVAFFTGDDPPQTVADAMHAAWTAFAHTGDPAHEGLPAWPAYDRTARATMHFDVECSLRHDPAPEQRAAWDGVL
jgi:para-nitrobenzyl esterase